MLIVISLLKVSFNYFDRLIEEQEHGFSMQKSLRKRLFWNPGSISLLVNRDAIDQQSQIAGILGFSSFIY
jgi:hypothetical protein